MIVENFNDVVTVPSAALSFTPDNMSDAQQKELKKNEEEGWSAVWFSKKESICLASSRLEPVRWEELTSKKFCKASLRIY